MNVTEDFVKEHLLIRQCTQMMMRLDVGFGSSFFEEHASAIVEFIRVFVDDYHHEKEENVLFKYLGAPGILVDRNPLPIMLREHAEGRAYCEAMAKDIANKDWASFVANAKAHAELLGHHINKEDNVLFKLAEQHLPKERKRDVLAEYEIFEEENDRDALWKRFQASQEALLQAIDAVAG